VDSKDLVKMRATTAAADFPSHGGGAPFSTGILRAFNRHRNGQPDGRNYYDIQVCPVEM
jgi:hypothetical protein